MTIDKETVAKVARLARLKVTEQEIETYAPQLNGIIKWVGSTPLLTISSVCSLSRKSFMAEMLGVSCLFNNLWYNVKAFKLLRRVR